MKSWCTLVNTTELQKMHVFFFSKFVEPHFSSKRLTYTCQP